MICYFHFLVSDNRTGADLNRFGSCFYKSRILISKSLILVNFHFLSLFLPMELEYLASFGDHVPLSQFKSDDKISVLAFNEEGRFLASGDHAGRCVIFSLNVPENGKPTVSFVSQIHAHKVEFDFFRSELSEPKINSLKWLPSRTLNPMLLTCNSHNAKLWRLEETDKITWTPGRGKTIDTYIPPQPKTIDHKYSAKFVKTFTDQQAEWLVDLQCLPDQKSFLMVDVGGVKLWDIERDVASVALCRIPQSEPGITTSAIHSALPFAFLVADECGSCRILDMRQQAEELTPSIEVRTADFGTHKHVDGSECVSSVAFSPDGSQFVVRTFGDLQQWDLRQTSKPVSVTNIQWFPNQMDWLSDEEFVKDTFRTAMMPSGNVVTGLYSADFVTWKPGDAAVKNYKAVSARTPKPPPEPGRDFTKRVTCAEAHPTKDIVAVVSTAALFLYTGVNK